MRQVISKHSGSILASTLIAAAFGVLAVSLIGWNAYGTTILLTYAQEGLSWCF